VALAEHAPRLDKYEVLEEIGHGGMATVYRARDRRLGRDVAIKVIHRHLRENKEVAARFVSEARAVAMLKHPSIVEVYDVSDDVDDERYLIVELVVGTTLRKLIAERGHMPAEIAAAVGIEIGGALDHAHQLGVIHRDVKPENVLVDLSERSPSARGASQERPADIEAGRVKITDFGIAKLLDAQGVTSTGQVLGSPAHMAPEQIEGGEVSARADVFGLGVLLYECMVGRLPFDGKNPAQVLRKVLDGTFTPPERARPSVGAGMSRIVEKALAREAADRYGSCAELCEALRAELDLLGFDNPRRELAEYLTSPESYVRDYEKRVVGRLVALGKKARTARQAPLAAAHFNRALAFRPDDAELLKQVAGLAHAERMRRLAIRAGGLLAVAGVCGAAAYGIARKAREPRLEVTRDLPVEPRSVVTPNLPTVTPSPLTTTSNSPTPVEPSGRKMSSPRVVPSGTAVAPPNGKLRRVAFVISGAPPKVVRMDGEAINYFNANLQISVGTHEFEFVPPNETCCDTPPKLSFTVTPGDTIQSIPVKIPFRDATLVLSGPTGTAATCANLFSGQLSPGERRIRLTTTKSYKCQINGPDEGSAPKETLVTVGPGVTGYLSWP